MKDEYTVIDMIKSKLRSLGCDGLAGEECGCGIDDLVPCDGNCTNCVPARSETTSEGIVYKPVRMVRIVNK